MRVGLIGAGLQARRLAPAVIAGEDQLVVVGARSEHNAARLAEDYGAVAVTGWEAVITRGDLDAVIVATPPDVRAEIAIAALEAGLNVLCEKPIARSSIEATAMLEASHRTGCVLSCGYNHRFHPAVAAAHDTVAAGTIGTPIFGRAIYGIIGRPGLENEWRSDPSVVLGGQLAEQGIHVIDLFQRMIGPVTGVRAAIAAAYWPLAPLEDNAFVLLEFDGGRIASLHSSTTQWRNRFDFEVYGQDGYVRVTGLGGSYGTETLRVGLRDFDGPFSETVTEYRGGDRSWTSQWRRFASAASNSIGPTEEATAALASLAVVEAAYAASRENATPVSKTAHFPCTRGAAPSHEI